jgi:hypothetical protein
VARSALEGSFAVLSAAIETSISELLEVLEKSAYEVVCCRHVSHLTTASGQEIQVGDVTVVPEPDGIIGLTGRIQQEINGAARASSHEDQTVFDPPHSLLIIRETAQETRPFQVGSRLSAKLERFLFTARLLTAGTAQSTYEVSGTTTLVSRISPRMRTFGKGMFDLLVRRTVRLSGDEGIAFATLGGLIDAANVKREGMVATSFDVAVSKFNISHGSSSPFEHLVDLATALEAVLIGADKETEGLTLRLRTRAAALLATADDHARALFDDVGQLYMLRSKLVHGGQIRQRDLHKIVARISTMPAEVAGAERHLGVALHYAVDRMRDVVRRAILARLCLAAGPDPLWPFDGDTTVDAILADDVQRAAWRTQWHEHLDALGVGYAASRARRAVDFTSLDT